MRPYTLLIFSFLLLGKLTAQQFIGLPEYGKVDISELQLKECPFEKSAGAMVLFREGESIYKLSINGNFSSIIQQTEYHVRIKIFSKNGFESGNVKIRYPVANFVKVTHLSAQTYNTDASGNTVVTKVDKNTIYDKTINKYFAEKIFAFPEVKEGSVIEYKYTIEGFSAGTWYFQQSIPVKFSRFIVDFPDELIVNVDPNISLPMQSFKDRKVSTNYSWYSMENIPALSDEPYMSCSDDYLQRLQVRAIAIDIAGIPKIDLIGSWPGMIRYLVRNEDFGEQLKKDIPRTSDLETMIMPVKDKYERMSIIHKYVRNNMEWNGYDNIWSMNGVKSAWKEKKGTSGEINLILINLLKDAGLKTAPILVSTTQNGLINTSIPGYSQFNKVMAYVTIGEKHYVLDATEKKTPSNLIPIEVMASEGLLIEKPDSFEWGWKTLWDGTHKDQREIHIMGVIDEKGSLNGKAIVKSSDYARLELQSLLKQGDDKMKEKLLTQPDMRIDSLVVQNGETDTLPLVQYFNFNVPTSSTSDYHYFSVNLFTGLNKNPFIANERQSDVFFAVNQKYSIHSAIDIPEGYHMDDLPKNIKMIMPDTSIVFFRRSNFDEGLLTVTMGLEFNSPVFPLTDYADFREFYKKLLELLNEKFVYRKKP